MAEFLRNEIYVVDQGNRRVKVLDKTSKEVIRCIPYREDWRAVDVLVHDGFLFLTDFMSTDVKVLDLETGAEVRTIGITSGPRKLDCPANIAIHAPPGSSAEEQVLLVSDKQNCRICVFNIHSGEYVRSIGEDARLTQVSKLVLWTPSDSSSDASTMIFVTDLDKYRIAVFSLGSGAYVRSVGGKLGSLPGELRQMYGITTHQPFGTRDEDAVLVVADGGNRRIQVFGLISGEVLRVIGESDGLRDPCDVLVYSCMRDDEEVWELMVSDCHLHQLKVFDFESGVLVKTIGGSKDLEVDQLHIPLGLFLIQDQNQDLDPYIMK